MSYPIDRDERLTFWERIWLPGILRAMAVTARHFFSNLFKTNGRDTVEYPEKKRRLPPGHRAEPRLMLREDGSVRCTACMLCVKACPADCISIECEEVDDPSVERRAKSFVIDLGRCAYCNLCVEACPCDAIRMDSGKYDRVARSRDDLILDMEALVENSKRYGSPLSRSL